ncbi:hypothetical protein ABFX02_13G165900 [Erythranthe guttata]
MKCITSRSLRSQLFSDHKYKHQNEFINRNINYTNRSFSLALSFRTRSLPAASSIFLAASAPVVGGKLSVLLQTGGVCLFAYWVVNFAVPEFIIKDIQSRVEKEDGDNPSEEDQR